METGSGYATVVTMRVVLGLAATALCALLLAGCGGGDEAAPAGGQVLRWGVGLPPKAEDPESTAWDILSSVQINVPWNLFDPLVKVDDDLRAVPNVAERWKWSDGGLTLTFHLRRDGRWTNGDPLTAHDYVFGWRYHMDEEPPGSGGGVFGGIAGAAAYVDCDRKERDCASLWDDVGVRALDDHTLEVRLVEPQPWFPELLGGYSCICFGPLHRGTVERFGADWAEPQNIVTSGPFEVAAWRHGEVLELVKNEGWRDADEVELDRIEVRFFPSTRRGAEAAAQALEVGELDVAGTDGATTSEHVVAYPFLQTEYVALDVEDIPDVRQRRAMALALDRRTIAEEVREGLSRPATSMTADGVPGFGRIASDFLRPEPQLERARGLMAAVREPRRSIELWVVDDPVRLEEAAEVRASWRRIGIEATIRSLPWEEFLDLAFERKLDDAHVIGWVYEAPYPAYLLDNWRCGNGLNLTGWCDPAYDRLLDRAAATTDGEARLDLYARAEAMLTGPQGAMPVIPIVWGSRVMLERPAVRSTFDLNKAALVDLTRVRVERG